MNKKDEDYSFNAIKQKIKNRFLNNLNNRFFNIFFLR